MSIDDRAPYRPLPGQSVRPLTAFIDPCRKPTELTTGGRLEIDEALARGWVLTAFAIREACVACPKCESLSMPGLSKCPHCGWVAL